MSVAFRRESDEEHLEPKFELPLPPGPNLVTARGLALIGAKVDALNLALGDAGGDAGDDAGNDAGNDAAREVIRRDLRYWRARLSTAVIAPIPAGDTVAFGTHVTFTLNGAPRSMIIVGSDEADPASNRITFTAPLARAMMGLAVGEVADFGGKVDAIAIVAIT